MMFDDKMTGGKGRPGGKAGVAFASFAFAVVFLLLTPISMPILALRTSHLNSAFTQFYNQASTFLIPVITLNYVSYAFLIVTIVIIAAAMVYMIAGILNSPNARAWSRLQLYECLLAVIILLSFLSVMDVFSVNLYSTYYNANLVGQPVAQSSGLPGDWSTINCNTATDLFQLATCDLAQFNLFAMGMFQALFNATLYASFTPGVTITLTPEIAPTNLALDIGSSLSSFFPQGADDTMGVFYSTLLLFYVLTQVQLFIVGGAVLWLSFFVTIGIIARTTGVSRSFGGAMIALGLGLGLIFPIMVTITYGFVNYQLSQLGSLATANGLLGMVYGYMMFLVSTFFSGGLVNGLLPSGYLLTAGGAAVAGLTFIPFLNFTIVDAFIVDFSKAVGERLDFLTLLSGLV